MGDVLYLPRGVGPPGGPRWCPDLPTYQGYPVSGTITRAALTVSAMQNWSWAAFLELLMPEALEAAAGIDKSMSLRGEAAAELFELHGCTMHQIDDEDVGSGGGRWWWGCFVAGGARRRPGHLGRARMKTRLMRRQ